MKNPPISKLYQYIEKCNGTRPWGRVLDAGTGLRSMQWMNTLETTALTAVTASRAMITQVEDSAKVSLRSNDRLVLGNWGDPQLLAGECFDTILMDYLIGAVEAYWPYGQDGLLQRLRPMIRGRVFLTGMEPYVPYPAETRAGAIVRRIGSLRDAILTLSGQRPYREFPVAWVVQQLTRHGFKVLDARTFPIVRRAGFINSQLDWTLQHIEHAGSEALRAALRSEVESLREEAIALTKREDGLRHGADYVITAEAQSSPGG